MTNRAAVWSLLLSREGEWITRSEVEQVGGLESMRRLREVREMASAQGYSFDQRREGGLLEYRIQPFEGQTSIGDLWSCVKCRAHPATGLQPTTDTRDRWRTGWCVPCGNKQAIFERTAQQ